VNTLEFISYLNSLDVKLWIEDGQLCCSVPKSAATISLRTELVERKEKILAFLGNVSSAASLAVPPIQPASRDSPLPLSFAQQRLWFLDQLVPGSPAYNNFNALRLSGPIDVATLMQCFDEIARRHESLRTTFFTVDGQAVQVIAPISPLSLPMIDLCRLSEEEREVEVQRLAVEEAQTPFDLARGPLMRVTLLRLREEEHALLLVMHHMIFDGWSLGVLIQEIATLYEALVDGKPSPLPELPIQYPDFAVWQKEWLPGEVLEEQLTYWRQQLDGAPTVLELPTDRPRPPIQGSRGATELFTLSKSLTASLQALSLEEASTLFIVMLAAFNGLLHWYTGQDDILVGSPIANRRRPELEGLIGIFINTLVLRTNLSGNPTFRELVDRVREMILDAHAHQDLPFEVLVQELQPERSLSHSPLFQVMFAFQNVPMESLALPGLTLSLLEADPGTADFDLTLSLTQAEELIGRLEYNTDLSDSETIKRMIGHFRVLLEGVVANPDRRISDLLLLTETERHRLLVERNDTQAEYPREKCVHELFEEQVERTPDAVAVVACSSTGPWSFGPGTLGPSAQGRRAKGSEHSDGQHLTYRALNRRANQLAHHLQGLGVGPEVLVGVHVERSLEMVVGMLGILKAGGAYVPLDPTYPQERLAFILRDIQAEVLLTQEQLAAGLPAHLQLVALDGAARATIVQESTNNPENIVRPDHLAYVIYTSGSTGQPKGVMVSQRALVQYVTAAVDHFAITPNDCILQFASISFDAAAEEIYPCLLSGAKLVLRTDAMLGSVETFLQKCADEGITLLDLPTAYWHVITTELESGTLTFPSTLRLVIIGGEAALPERLEMWRVHAPTHIRLTNTYGPTEATIVTTMCDLKGENAPKSAARAPIGHPIANTQAYVLNSHLQPVPVGVPGELYIGGDGLARGYLNRPALTAGAFVPNPFSSDEGNGKGGTRLYRTGDLVRYLSDDSLEFLGRVDRQVKIRGFRIELGEIETVLAHHPAVWKTAVIATGEAEAPAPTARRDKPGEKQLVAYITSGDGQEPTVGELRRFLEGKLPGYMVPSVFVTLEEMPLTPSGKIDRRALPAPEGKRPELEIAYVSPRSEAERIIAAIWQDVLGVEQVGVHDNFFDLGGHSLLVTQVFSRLKAAFGREFPMVDMFRYTTVVALAQYLGEAQEQTDVVLRKAKERANAREALLREGTHTRDVAIIGMAARFPGADDLDQFWKNLQGGVESITFFSEDELLDANVPPELLNNTNYVKARAIISDIECFDARFFGLSPREAEVMDPQERVFLEYARHALENAGYDAERYDGRVGVYAGTSLSTYLLNNLYPRRRDIEQGGQFQVVISTDKDFLATRVSYRLNLQGPSFTVQTACSTSLVAVHLACQGLLTRECDMALVGGVSLTVPQTTGYLYEEGGILSPDGHCRPFDARAQGLVGGNGVGIVVLKRLADALEDGDTVHAVIKGSAINNDGARKIGYTAPSEDGQVEVISEALAVAGVDPETITYVEAHGTGTVLGDPIEVAALTRVFRASTSAKRFCGLGSVKSNVGHLDTAAGVAGLIKTVLALQHKQLPPTLHFAEPNPEIDLANSPFYVSAELRDWETDSHPRRAGVSSFGLGGTNAHVVLEEASPLPPTDLGQGEHLLVLSAKTDSALKQASDCLARHLQQHPELDLADVAYTLLVGRRAFSHRQVLMCRDLDDAVTTLEKRDPKRILTGLQGETDDRPVVFMFPGLGDQYPNMARGLYQAELVFRAHVDRCCEFLEPHLGLDLREVIFAEDGQKDQAAHKSETLASSDIDLRRMLGRGEDERVDEATQRLNRTSYAHPAVFVIEYALVQLLMEWGIRPQAVIGHSIGEYVAACVAGVLSLEDALTLVARRAQMIQELSDGAMLAVPLSEEEVQPHLGEELSLSAINGPSLCVLAGPPEATAELENSLIEQGIACRRVQTSHAFHSKMLEPIMGPLTELVNTFRLKPPAMPYVSNLTGTWITAEQATDPNYWAKHTRHPVRFADGVNELWEDPDCILLEVGPGHTLSTMALQHPASDGAEWRVTSTIPHSYELRPDREFLLSTLGKLWMAGVPIDWGGFYGDERRRRVQLPTYPFARDRYWIDPPERADESGRRQRPLDKRPDVADWFYLPSWKRSALVGFLEPDEWAEQGSYWLVFLDECGLGSQIVQRLERAGQRVITVVAGEEFRQINEGMYTLNPQERDEYNALLGELGELDKYPQTVVHLWNVTPPENAQSDLESLERAQGLGFYSLLFLAQTFGDRRVADSLHIEVISNNMQEVIGDEMLHLEKATLLGPCRVIAQEYPNITCRSIDIAVAESGTRQEEELLGCLMKELAARPSDTAVAYRGKHRWVQTFEPVRLDAPERRPERLREEGVYLITGGLGGMGFVLAKYLARTVRARLVLTGRSAFPAREEWDHWLATHDGEDSTSRKIEQVQSLEELGARVLVLSADVTDRERMRAAVTQARERFGVIHGVIHAAGVATGGMIQLKTPKMAEEVLAPKVKGTLVLDAIFKDMDLDFLVLFSSLTSVLGGFGEVDYCAANAFLDAFAHRSTSEHAPFTVSINWDMWQEVGMGVSTAVPVELQQWREESIERGILPQEGVDAFVRILSHELSQVLVSTQDLHILLEQTRDLTALDLLEELDKIQPSRSLHSRPALENAYVAPTNEIEQTIAEIWQDLLGIEQIGIHDNLFELGGHSLLAIQVTSRIRDIFAVQMPMRRFFESPTVAELALAIAEGQVGDVIGEDKQSLEALLSKAEGLSDDELDRLLAE